MWWTLLWIAIKIAFSHDIQKTLPLYKALCTLISIAEKPTVSRKCYCIHILFICFLKVSRWTLETDWWSRAVIYDICILLPNSQSYKVTFFSKNDILSNLFFLNLSPMVNYKGLFKVSVSVSYLYWLNVKWVSMEYMKRGQLYAEKHVLTKSVMWMVTSDKGQALLSLPTIRVFVSHRRHGNHIRAV